MASSAKARKRKPAPQRSKLPRYVVKLHDDDFFDEEDAEALRFDNFDDAVECCADLNIPFFVDAGNKKLVFWFVRVDDEGRDRDGSFEPQLVKKNQTRITGMDNQILSLYAKGLTTREIAAAFKELYDADVSPALVSKVTDAVMEQVVEW